MKIFFIFVNERVAADKAACPHGTCPHGRGGLRRETVPAVNFHGLWRFSKSKEAIGSTAASRPRAQDEALQILCATLLTPERVTVHNIPQILDVMQLIELLRRMGVEVEQLAEDTYSFCAREIDFDYLRTEDYRQRCTRLRGSVMLIGPMLARFGVGYIPKPRRRTKSAGGGWTTHFLGFQKLGAKFNFDIADEFFMVEGRELKGTYMLLDEASVTGTANIVMAAVMAKGFTTIYNAACEPYLQQLCKMLNRMGARISGIASNLLTIEGVESLGGTEHTLLPDMIEVGSFIGMAAMNQSELTIRNVSFENLGIIPAQFARMGIRFEQHDDDIYIPQQEHYSIDTFLDGSIMTIADAPWPGLTPDLLSIFLVVATQAKGAVLIHQKMFESRLFFVDKLIDMGAQIILCDPHRATVIGHDHRIRLRATRMTSPDIRAGVALLIAAMSAEGVSTIQNIDQIDRGYKDIDGRLNASAHGLRASTTANKREGQTAAPQRGTRLKQD